MLPFDHSLIGHDTLFFHFEPVVFAGFVCNRGSLGFESVDIEGSLIELHQIGKIPMSWEESMSLSVEEGEHHSW